MRNANVIVRARGVQREGVFPGCIIEAAVGCVAVGVPCCQAYFRAGMRVSQDQVDAVALLRGDGARGERESFVHELVRGLGACCAGKGDGGEQGSKFLHVCSAFARRRCFGGLRTR